MLPGCRSSGTLVAGLSAARGPGTGDRGSGPGRGGQGKHHKPDCRDRDSAQFRDLSRGSRCTAAWTFSTVASVTAAFLAESSPLIASPSGICRYLTVRPVVSARLRMSLRPRPGTFHRPERREEASSMLDEAALSGARDGVAAAATPWPGPDSSVSWTADRWLLSLHLGDGTGTGPRCNGCPWRRAQAVWAR